MNTTFDWELWKPIFLSLAGGTTLVFLLASAAQRLVGSMSWRRTIWQIAFLSLSLLVLAETTGAQRWAWSWLRQTTADAEGTLLVESKILGEPNLLSLSAPRPQESGAAFGSIRRSSAAPSVIGWPAILWLSGTAAALSWIVAIRVAFLVRVRRRIVRDESVLACADAIAHRLGMARRVRLSEARDLAGPIAFGVFCPSITLPEGFSRRFSTAQQEVMLAHELAHLSARDPFWHLLADLVTALLWWHPLIWFSKRELRAASEAAADDASLVVENGPATLAECLVELGGRLTRTRPLGWLGVEGDSFRSGLGKRVKRLVTLDNQSWNCPSRARLWLARGLASAPLVVLVVVGTAWARPESPAAGTLRQAFQRSVLGIALTAAMPAPQEEFAPPTNVVEEVLAPPAPAPIPSPVATVPSPALHTRMFKIDFSTFRQSLANVRSLPSRHTNAAAQIVEKTLRTNSPAAAAISGPDQMLKDAGDLFTTAGVDFSLPGKQLLFMESIGSLMVRATLQDLDIVEQAIQILNRPLPQLTIEVKFCEVTTEDARALGFDWFLGGVFTQMFNSSVSQNTNFHGTGILTEPQSRVVFRALEQRSEVNILHSPKMTTLSGRQAQMKSVRVRYIVTDLDWSYQATNSAGSTNDRVQAQPVAEQFELGPVLDVIPYVLADGQTIQMALIPTLTEFLGYDLDQQDRRETVTMPDGRKEIVVVPAQPSPIFRKLQMVSSAIVRDGQTVVIASGSEQFLANPKRNAPLAKGTRIPGEIKKTSLLIFVTPTLVDPAGNRIHKPEDIPPGIPAQPATLPQK